MIDCQMQEVQVCDKVRGRSYYPKFWYNFQGSIIAKDSTREKIAERTGEIEVVRKILPIDVAKSVPLWDNETVDIFRVCPENSTYTGGMLITVIGRNFYNSRYLMCKFVPTFPPDEKPHPPTPAMYLTTTRVYCRAPQHYNTTVHVHVANDGRHFSKSYAVFRYENQTYNYTDPSLLASTEERMSKCLERIAEQEDERVYEQQWFSIQTLEVAKISFDFSWLPTDMKYGEHYRIAIYAIPSYCVEEQCKPGTRIRINNKEESPCTQPMELSTWFLDDSVDKHTRNDISMLALRDTVFKVEIHLIYSLYIATVPFFKNSTIVWKVKPSRANVSVGVEDRALMTRTLDESISYERKQVFMQYIWGLVYKQENAESLSPPLNLPPRFKDFERGRVLFSFNRSTEDEKQPIVIDPFETVFEDVYNGQRGITGTLPGIEYWKAPLIDDEGKKSD
jgi:hypothetical protein